MEKKLYELPTNVIRISIVINHIIRECTDYVSTFPFFYNGMCNFEFEKDDLIVRHSDGTFFIKNVDNINEIKESYQHYLNCKDKFLKLNYYGK